MATIGIESTINFSGTHNVIDTTQVYDPTASYQDGELVNDGDYLKSVELPNLVTLNSTKYFIEKDEIVYSTLSNVYYKANKYSSRLPHSGNTTTAVVDENKYEYNEMYLKLTDNLTVGEWYVIGLDTPNDEYYSVKVLANDDVVERTTTISTLATVDTTISGIIQDFPPANSIPTVGTFVRSGKSFWFVVTTPVIPIENVDLYIPELLIRRKVKKLLPFDSTNTTAVIQPDNIQYGFTIQNDFNAITISGIIGDYLTISLVGVEIGTGLAKAIPVTTIPIDTKIDDNGLLPNQAKTFIISLPWNLSIGTVDITIGRTDVTKNAQIGGIFSNMAIDEGATEFDLVSSVKDYNSYQPDPWGEIEQGVKPVVKSFNIKVTTPTANYNRTYERMKYYAGKYVTIDATDNEFGSGGDSFSSLIARGIITNISLPTKINGGNLQNTYTFNLSFLEII